MVWTCAWNSLGHMFKSGDASYRSSWVQMVPDLKAVQPKSPFLYNLYNFSNSRVKPIFEVWVLICLGWWQAVLFSFTMLPNDYMLHIPVDHAIMRMKIWDYFVLCSQCILDIEHCGFAFHQTYIKLDFAIVCMR